MSVVYDEMVRKKDALEKLEQQGKRKYEYDSDEDVNVSFDGEVSGLFLIYTREHSLLGEVSLYGWPLVWLVWILLNK